MWNIPTPAEIEARAAAAGANMSMVCRRAGLARSTFTRAKQGRTSLTTRSLQEIDRVLREIEAAAPPRGEAA